MLHRLYPDSPARRPAALLVTLLSAVLLVTFSLGGCGSDEPDSVEMSPELRGDRGENCSARNDCVEGLACVNNICVQHEYNISPEASHCEIIECENDSECCSDAGDQQISEDECDDLEQLCSDGSNDACNQYDFFCTCGYECQNQQCVSVGDADECNSDWDCFGAQSCINGECLECQQNTDCDGDELCNDGICEEACEVDSNCLMFHECEAGECVESGCTTDRECIHYTDNHRAECHDETGSCSLPCDTDSECNQGASGQFQVCDQGVCVFIGCESDAECRAALHLEGTSNYERAHCVDH